MEGLYYPCSEMALICFAVTAKLICIFVFAYTKSRFSGDAAHMVEVLIFFTSKMFALIT